MPVIFPGDARMVARLVPARDPGAELGLALGEERLLLGGPTQLDACLVAHAVGRQKNLLASVVQVNVPPGGDFFF